MQPRIHLAIDNCFAAKRWTHPLEWMQIARDAGITCIEASADNENDPMYTPADAQQRWLEAVHDASAKTGVRVVNLFSGHGTYSTLGLAHPDVSVRDHMQHQWLEPMIRKAVSLDAGLGFFCHAFAQSILDDPQRYAEALDDLQRRLAELAQFAQAVGLGSLSVEQMYTPHQIPWTIDGARALLHTVNAGGAPLYITLDTGHHIGQPRFLRPTREQIAAHLDDPAANPLWLGPNPPAELDAALRYVEARPYLFTEPQDGDLYAWLRAFGGYAPIIHLQQTDGTASAHRPFTPQHNLTGVVDPQKLLAALSDAYAAPADDNLPTRCEDIYLTFEIFGSTPQHPADLLAGVRESAAYWRQFIPQDGLTLDALNAT
ncbi:MAG: sugar phosphate isomerase/epimerase [Chloroflexi bacterium]|nr:sugar phosphate isomerase/epimerase [Chloroflexota bacterium]